MRLSLRPVSDTWQDRVIAGLLIASLLLLVAVLVFSVAAASGAWSAAGSSGDVKRGTAIAACRSAYYGDVAEATTTAQVASYRLQELLTSGLLASVVDDETTVGVVLTQVEDARQRLTQATDALTAATAEYVDATADAASDPDAFLDRCKAENRTSTTP